MSAGLAASTVTPGITAPEVSLTTPAMVALPEPCAHAAAGRNNTHDRTTSRAILWAFIQFASSQKRTGVLHFVGSKHQAKINASVLFAEGRTLLSGNTHP